MIHDWLDTVNEWLATGQPVALATVTDTWGSSPRGVGSKMVIAADGTMHGSVSGGCVEGAVMEEALQVLAEGRPRLLTYGVTTDQAWAVGLSCGGTVRVFVEPIRREWWRVLADAVRQHHSLTMATALTGDAFGAKTLYADDGAIVYSDTPQQSPNDAHVFVDSLTPPPHLVMVGGVHVAVHLAAFALQMGWRVSLIDPRPTFASRDRFPDVHAIYHDYPDDVLPSLHPNPQTFVAVLSHDPKIDDPAIISALGYDVAYVGVLSSRRTHAERLQRLQAHGISTHTLSQLQTPIGLNIGARTPQEIALSIMAELVNTHRKGQRIGL